jgi:hydroxyacyl-ACP dehydratase HTD2-like protein with hotdog domain
MVHWDLFLLHNNACAHNSLCLHGFLARNHMITVSHSLFPPCVASFEFLSRNLKLAFKDKTFDDIIIKIKITDYITLGSNDSLHTTSN